MFCEAAWKYLHTCTLMMGLTGVFSFKCLSIIYSACSIKPKVANSWVQIKTLNFHGNCAVLREGQKECWSQSCSPNVFSVAIAAQLALHTVVPTSFVAMSPVPPWLAAVLCHPKQTLPAALKSFWENLTCCYPGQAVSLFSSWGACAFEHC